MNEVQKTQLRDDTYRRLWNEECSSALDVNGNNLFAGGFTTHLRTADDFAVWACKSLLSPPDEKDGSQQSEEQLMGLLVDEFLRTPILSQSLLQFDVGVELGCLVSSASAQGEFSKLCTFLWPLMGAQPDQYDSERRNLAKKIISGLVSESDILKENRRTRRQRCDRHFREAQNIINYRKEGRRYLGCLQMKFLLNPARPDKDNASSLVHFRKALLKDWKKKGLYVGVLDYLWFVLPDCHKGAVLHFVFFVDLNVANSLGALADQIGMFWNSQVTQGLGFYQQDAYSFNPGIMYNPACVIDVCNPASVGRVMADIRFLCEREMYLKVKEVSAKEAFGHASVRNDHWESRKKIQQAAVASTPVGGEWGAGGFVSPLSPVVSGSGNYRAAPKIFLGFDHVASESVFHRLGELANNHLLMAGPSGCGKSITVGAYCRGLIMNEIPFAILDPHGQALCKLPIETKTVSNGMVDAWGVNPLRLYFAEWEKRGIDGQVDEKVVLINLCTGNSLGHRERAVIKQALLDLYARSGLTKELPPEGWSCPDFDDLISLLDGYLEVPEWKGSRKIIDGVLAALRTGFGNRVFNQKNCLEARQLIGGKGLRIDLSQLEGAEQGVVMEAFLRDVWYTCKELGPVPVPAKKNGDQFRMVIVIDEAHLLNLGGNPDSTGRMLDVLVREGRKFGICLVMATQSLKDLSEVVRKNTAAWMIFRLNDDSEARVVARKFKVSADAVLGLQNAREAFFWDGGRPAANRLELTLPGDDGDELDGGELESLIPEGFGSSLI